ncbi:MAG: hypothetical protein OXD44_11450, partial [Gammaproteobacteria bacterium]|nr:hypothetical protein [Gammaproteobacteria bacterium]
PDRLTRVASIAGIVTVSSSRKQADFQTGPLPNSHCTRRSEPMDGTLATHPDSKIQQALVGTAFALPALLPAA